jgi:hypothetical protein
MTVPAAVLDAALAQARVLLRELPAAQLEALAAGQGRLVYRPEVLVRPRPAEHDRIPEPDLAAVTAEINALTSPDAVVEYLTGRGFTVPMLRSLARALGPTVSAAGRGKAELVRNIAEGTAGYRIRSAAMSGGAWGTSIPGPSNSQSPLSKLPASGGTLVP